MKTVYSLRILLVSMVAFLLGVVVALVGNIVVLAIALSVIIVTFFVYEGVSYDQLRKKENKHDFNL